MRWFVFCTLWLVYFLPNFAAAQLSNVQTTHALSTSNQDPTLPSIPASPSVTAARGGLSRPSPSHSSHVTVTRRPHPLPTYHTYVPPPPPPPPPPPTSSSTPMPRTRYDRRQAPVAIVFEVLGGLIGLFFVLSAMRCLYSWKKTPSRDRIAALLNRHRLQRELEELAQEPRRRSTWRAPPPPYVASPPTYDAVVGSPLPSHSSSLSDSPTTLLMPSPQEPYRTLSPSRAPSLVVSSLSQTSPPSQAPSPPTSSPSWTLPPQRAASPPLPPVPTSVSPATNASPV